MVGGRKRLNGDGRKIKRYKKVAIDYSHKLTVLNYLSSHKMSETIEHFYSHVTDKKKQKMKKCQIYAWSRNRDKIEKICANGGGKHRVYRPMGAETILSTEAKHHMVLWINSMRRDGIPVTHLMLSLKVLEMAEGIGIDDGNLQRLGTAENHL